MQESTFGFQRRPFTAVPDPAVFFPAPSAAAAQATLARVIERGEGPALLVGPAGVGKTLLCNLLEQQFQRQLRVATLACGQLGTLRSLLQSILHEMHQPFQGLEEGELRLALLDFLEPSEECPHGLLLLVDEAHHLSIELLEELRMIGNLVRDGLPRVRLVLSGNGKLEELFTNPRLESLNQRLAARCYLEGLSRDETRQYILQLTTDAGGREEIWTEDGLRSVYEATGGVPRLINQVCDHALLLAANSGRRAIDLPAVEEAWADLQQLPAPWHDAGVSDSQTVIEFGTLEESGLPAEPCCEIDLDPSQESLELGDEIELGSQGIDLACDDALGGDQQRAFTPRSCHDECADGGGPSAEDVFVSSDVFAVPPAASHDANCRDTVQYQLAPETAEYVAEIERRLEEIELEPGSIEPPPPSPPLEAPDLNDPFGHFQEEEVVIDHQLPLGGPGGASGTPICSQESQLLAQALSMRDESQPLAAGAMDPPPPALADLDDAQAVESEELSAGEGLELYDPPTVVPMFAASRDDRDLIVVEDDPRTNDPPEGCRDVLDQLRGEP